MFKNSKFFLFHNIQIHTAMRIRNQERKTIAVSSESGSAFT